MSISRWTAHAALATSLAIGAFAVPAPARAQSYDLARAIADIANVMSRSNQPYYGRGDYRRDDRLVTARDAYGHDRDPRAKCNKHGKCKAEYYDPRYDQRGYERDDDDRYERDDDRYDGDDDRDDDDLHDRDDDDRDDDRYEREDDDD